MPKTMENLIEQYVEAVKKIYGSHIRSGHKKSACPRQKT